MATAAIRRPAVTLLPGAEVRHRLRLWSAIFAAAGVIVALSIYGYPYYRLDLAARLASPLHPILKPSGMVGLRLGMLGLFLYFLLFLYPVRKRWPWLGRIGKTRHWLDFHVLLGITAPLIITFHSAFKLQGLAGTAYWIMIAVALSGMAGRYLYAQIPRSLDATGCSLQEMETQAAELARQLSDQAVFTPEQLAPFVRAPSRDQVRGMSLWRVVLNIVKGDLARPFQVSGLRRRLLRGVSRWLTLGGLLPSRDLRLESVITSVRRQSWLLAKMAFLERAQQVFHLWHVVHRPFSYSFAVLISVHIAVMLLLGYY